MNLYLTIDHSPLTIHQPYSYGDSAGIAPDFPFNPDPDYYRDTENQNRNKCRREFTNYDIRFTIS